MRFGAETIVPIRILIIISCEYYSEGAFECMNSTRIRTERGLLGFLPTKEESEKWMILIMKVLEECVLWNYDYPAQSMLERFHDLRQA